MTKYLQGLNSLICDAIRDLPQACIFGQNIDTGTYISGLSRGLEAHESSRIVNTPNVENTVCGMGFGAMLGGANAVYFAKQLDFMLLGIDQFYNTYNFIRAARPESELGSFSIILWVCDQGMQGPQSSFNGMGDICSLARFPGYPLSTRADAENILKSQLNRPGFRIIGLSSRLGRTELVDTEPMFVADDHSIFQYAAGDDATIVCFNFGLRKGLELMSELNATGLSASLYTVNYQPTYDWAPIRENLARSRHLIVIDDSKSVHLVGYKMICEIEASGVSFKSEIVRREDAIDYGPCDDDLATDWGDIVTRLHESSGA